MGIFYKKHFTTTIPLLFFGIICIFFANPNARFLLAPIIMCVLITYWLFISLQQRDQEVPIIDIGMICVSITCLYSIYPLFNFLLGGLNFGILSDGRLQNYQPNPLDIGLFHFRHVLYLLFLACFYSYFRKKNLQNKSNYITSPTIRTRNILVIGYIFFEILFFLLKLSTGISFNHGYDETSVENKLAINASAPTILLQISGKLMEIEFVFQTALIALLVSMSDKKKWLALLILLIIFVILKSFLEKSSRSGLMYFLFGVILFYHRFKGLRIKFLFISMIILFSFFIFLGFYRSFDSFTSLSLAFNNLETAASATNEFQALLGTSYDVYQMKLTGTSIPWYLLINDFMPLLPPQQVIQFSKTTGSEWYLIQKGISGTGQGYMWGVISQSIIGFDWFELAFRGALLGYFLARVHRWYQKNNSGFFETLFYIILCMSVLGTYRDTTGAILWPFFWSLLPFYIIIKYFGGYTIQLRNILR